MTAGDPEDSSRSQPVPRRRPQAVLFACSENGLRSPMAEAFGRHYFGHSVYFASAGVRSGRLDPLAVAAMEEIGIDISAHHPHTFEDLEDSGFDLIVSLSPEAHHKALEFTRALAIDVIYWPTLDPSVIEGSRDRALDAYRTVRDSLAGRIKVFFAPHPVNPQEEAAKSTAAAKPTGR